jgi:hypothetical protein
MRAEVREETMLVLAEAWLIARGADPGRLRERIRPSEFDAADAETQAAEDLLRHAATRFDVHDSASSPGAVPRENSSSDVDLQRFPAGCG